MIDGELVAQLEASAAREQKLGRANKREFLLDSHSGKKLTRWKFNDWDYYNAKAGLPTRARGLFTCGDRIVLRGYNKFFSTDETAETQLNALQTETKGPYVATVKENGFMVLIGVVDGKLVVGSKNTVSSDGDQTNGNDKNSRHAEVAREWVQKCLKSVNRTETELAAVLEQNDWTAIGEVCDDEFEEHVLEYPPAERGIYLNGLNRNSNQFETADFDTVSAFAKEFGFRQTGYTKFNTYAELDKFLEECEATGKWGDRPIEGFVVRCKREVPGFGLIDFFWKAKFEMPYLLYREWREVLRTYLQQNANQAYICASTGKHPESSMEFLSFAQWYLHNKPEVGRAFLNQSVGFFEIRDSFLQTPKQEIKNLKLEFQGVKVVLVPVATIGCGKSTIGSILTELSGNKWVQIESDNIRAKRNKLARQCELANEALELTDLVYFDRNNTRRADRKQIYDDIRLQQIANQMDPKFVCLNFLPTGVTPQSIKLTRERVINRGDNHQNIQASSKGPKWVDGIMRSMEKSYQIVNVNDAGECPFDVVINLSLQDTVANVKKILRVLAEQHWKGIALPPSDDAAIQAAFKKALTLKKTEPVEPAADPRPKAVIQYFGLLVDEKSRLKLIDVAREMGAPLDKIEVQPSMHVTLAHFSQSNQFKHMRSLYVTQPLSQYYTELPAQVVLSGEQEVEVTSLAFSNDCVAFGVNTLNCANVQPHITVGTANGIPAVRANDLFFEEGTVKLELPEKLHLKLKLFMNLKAK